MRICCMKKHLLVSVLISFVSLQCAHKQYCTSTENIQKQHIIIKEQPTDSTLYKTILPYKVQLDNDLNIPIAQTITALEKNKNCNNLAQLVFESMQFYADTFIHQNYYILINYGGLRANLPQGQITKRHIFELMPFDNTIVILELNSSQLQELMQKSNSNTKLLVKPKNNANTNILVTSDYLYQGGDDCAFLKSARKINTGNFFIRDAIIQYCQYKQHLNIPCFYQQ